MTPLGERFILFSRMFIEHLEECNGYGGYGKKENKIERSFFRSGG
jgi:hypothetical protein